MQPQPPQPGIFDNVQKFLYVIVAICLVVAGIYIGMKFNTPTVEGTANSARLKPFTPTPEPEPHPYPPVPPPKPHPEPKVNFKPNY